MLNSSIELLRFFQESCDKTSKTHYPNITLGVELEFFILNANKSLCSLDEGQLFFQALAEIATGAWLEYETIGEKKCLSKVKIQTGDERWICVSYEYPPHMLELALSVHASVSQMKFELFYMLELIQSVCDKFHFSFMVKPILPLEMRNQVKLIGNDQQNRLRSSRLDGLKKSPYANDLSLVDFPSFLCATHFHLGGINWWDNSEFCNNLYRIEPFLMNLATGITVGQRWEHYYKVFHDFPLVGFPKIENWSLDWWSEQLYHQSYIREAEVLSGHGQVNIQKLRDLQLIRPRSFGTIEFRSDPALGSVDEIARLATYRLAQYVVCENKLPAWIPSYSQAYQLWTESYKTGRRIPEDLQHRVREFLILELGKRFPSENFELYVRAA